MARKRGGSRAAVRVVGTAALGWALGLAACGGEQSDPPSRAEGEAEIEEAEIEEAEIALVGQLEVGRQLYDEETFGGNGRTCLTCHTKRTGTLSPEQVEEVFDEDPQAPLFLHDGSDNFLGTGTSRILKDATILVRRGLPEGVELAGDPGTRAIVVRRGIPTTINTPALDPVLMLDGRGASLTGQANGAIRGHAQATIFPTTEQLDAIATFEKKGRRFFSSGALFDFSKGGPAPALPKGTTPAQKRGRKWFAGAPASSALSSASPRDGLCATCHSGAMMNETSAALAQIQAPPFFLQGSTRFQSVLVSEMNEAQNPVFDFVIHRPDGTTVTASSPDPGRALVTGTFVTTPFGLQALFKIPPLWGVKKTGPYFHDNSARTLADVVDHYARFFETVTAAGIDGDPPLIMTAQDRADLVAYLKLL